MPPRDVFVHPWAKRCSKSVRKASRARTIDISQEATQTGAMRKTAASKQRHERGLKRSDTCKEVGERPFSADGIAHQQSEKINGFVGAEASSSQMDLIGKGFK